MDGKWNTPPKTNISPEKNIGRNPKGNLSSSTHHFSGAFAGQAVSFFANLGENTKIPLVRNVRTKIPTSNGRKKKKKYIYIYIWYSVACAPPPLHGSCSPPPPCGCGAVVWGSACFWCCWLSWVFLVLLPACFWCCWLSWVSSASPPLWMWSCGGGLCLFLMLLTFLGF